MTQRAQRPHISELIFITNTRVLSGLAFLENMEYSSVTNDFSYEVRSCWICSQVCLHLSCSCYKIHEKDNLRKGRFLLACDLKHTVWLWGRCVWRVWVANHTASVVRKQTEAMVGVFCSPFHSVQDFYQGNEHCSLQSGWVLPHLSLSGHSPTDVCRSLPLRWS